MEFREIKNRFAKFIKNKNINDKNKTNKKIFQQKKNEKF